MITVCYPPAAGIRTPDIPVLRAPTQHVAQDMEAPAAMVGNRDAR